MPTNKERTPTQGSNQNSLNQQNEKKQTSQTDDRSSGKSGMSRSDHPHQRSPWGDTARARCRVTLPVEPRAARIRGRRADCGMASETLAPTQRLRGTPAGFHLSHVRGAARRTLRVTVGAGRLRCHSGPVQ